jgi:hypothetical protein
MSTIPEGPGEGNLVPRPTIERTLSISSNVAASDVAQTLTIAKVLADSGMFPDARAAAQAAVKIMAGRELGFGPVASMCGINVIKGRITLSANLIAAAVRRSNKYGYAVRRLDDQVCAIEFFMNGKLIGISSFTLDDARKAGLANGENWKKYPRNMLFARAVSNGTKWYCPDIFDGPVYVPDELDPTAQLDPETGAVVCPPTDMVVEAKVVGPEPVIEAETLHARVVALIAETNTDLTKLLVHYRVTTIDDLTSDQCVEAIRVLTLRKRANEFPVSQ